MANSSIFDEWYANEEISSSALFYLKNKKFEEKKVLYDEDLYKISIAISTYKRSNLLLRLVDSIISQTYDQSKIEIVIVDDCSNDDTSVIVSKYIRDHSEYSITFLENEKNLGVGESKKKAYIKCTGDIIIFADDDDYFIDNSYFLSLNDMYKSHENCLMTVAGTIVNFEKENSYELQKLNFCDPISNKEYLNGFVRNYTKPNSMFTMSLRANKMISVSLEELIYFNDTPLYLYGLLADGMVYPMNKAVGIYYVNGKNMTGNARLDYILGNLEAKDDIYRRAIKSDLISQPLKWYRYNIGMTASYYLKFNRDPKAEDKLVWTWLKEHYSLLYYYHYIFNVIVYRRKHSLPVKMKYIKL